MIDNMKQLITLSESALAFYAIDFVILMIFMSTLSFLADRITKSGIKETLSHEDNFAVGIAFAGSVIAMAILMMGVSSGEAGETYVEEITLMGAYGLAAIALMTGTRVIFDKVNLREIKIKDEIISGNVAAGVVDAFNLIASAIIIRAAMTWADGGTLAGLWVVAVIFLLSQVLLVLVTCLRTQSFNRHHQDLSYQGEIKNRNIALAIRFSGHRLGVGLALTAASGVVIYEPTLLAASLLTWLLIAVTFFALQAALSFILKRVLLAKINTEDEVVVQHNVAIGAIEAAIDVGIGFAFVGLFV